MEFRNLAPASIYGDPPSFDFPSFEEAKAANEAVNAVLNAASGVLNVGDSAANGLPIFRIGFGVEGDGLLRLTAVWESVPGPDSPPDIWYRVSDSDVFPFLDDGNFAVFTPTTARSPSQIGVFRASTTNFYLDSNGNGQWDGSAAGDTASVPFGLTTDLPVIGDWNGDGTDDIGLWRPSARVFFLDSNGNNQWDGPAAGDTQRGPFGLTTDLPVIGDWDGDGMDEIGVWRPSTRVFYLDANANGLWDGSAGGDIVTAPLGSAPTDAPLSGDWNNDGSDEIGIYQVSSGRFFLDFNGNYVYDQDDIATGPFGIPGDTPLTGDWNNGGRDEIGVYRPSTRVFFLDANGNGKWDGEAAGDVASTPFGAPGDLPVAGRW